MAFLADLPELVGFFSYSRSDDEHSGGALSRLRARIYDELRLQLGRDVRLWQDTAAIPHGTLWEDEIKRAIGESAFFIPIVTPSAVASNHCKFEFEAFLKRESELLRGDLVFPILYIRVPALGSEQQWRQDDVLKIIHFRQYADWTKIRQHDLASFDVGKRIEDFCQDIVEALLKPWVSPEERRRKEEAEALQRAEEEHRRQEAEAKRIAEEERQRRQRAEQEEFRRNAEAEALRRAEDERRRKEEAEAKLRVDQDEHQRQAAEARRRAEDDRRRQESNARPLEYAQGASAVIEQADITGVAHQKPEPGNVWQPSRRALAIGGVLVVIFLGFVGVWFATPRPEPVAPRVTTAQPLPASVPPAETPTQPAPALITPTTPLVQPASGAIGPLPLERERALKPKDSLKECDNCPEMVVVPAGSFTMGSPGSEKDRSKDEGPQHSVTFARQFAVGKFSVTFDEWDTCVADSGCTYKPDDQGWGRGRNPVFNISWNDANTYVAWLSGKTGKTYRLLSEAEREYVTRAGTTSPFWWGDTISPEQANYDVNFTYGNGPGEKRHRTLPVNSFQPNPWGLYQIHGNVWEWVQDCYNDGYAGAPSNGLAWTSGDCSRRVVRGGSWFSNPRNLRSANRNGYSSDLRDDDLGFRAYTSLQRP
jgi:formylglycine-generating enzyme required for sulfatase activity